VTPFKQLRTTTGRLPSPRADALRCRGVGHPGLPASLAAAGASLVGHGRNQSHDMDRGLAQQQSQTAGRLCCHPDGWLAENSNRLSLGG
jgi:hypothetical protein